MKCQRPLIGFALLLPFCNCALAQEGITFTNRLATFTNLQGVAYHNVRLVRADLDGIIYREGASGGRVCYTNLPAAFLDSLGISSNAIAVAKTRADRRAAADAYYWRSLQQQAQQEMAAKALAKKLIIPCRQSARPAGTYSAGIAEIIRMLDANIDAPVILAYIQNSPIPYDPDGTELVALKEHGASAELLMALLHHGDELSLQLAQAQSAANPPPADPANDYPPAAAYPPYPYDYSDSSYVPYPATYYSYGYGWPLAYWPSVRISAYRPYGYAQWRLSEPHTPRLVFTPTGGRTSSSVVHSGGSRGSGHSGGHSGGRSR